MVEFLENILAFSWKRDLVYPHQLLAEDWLLFCVFNEKRKDFAAEENSSLHKRELWILDLF